MSTASAAASWHTKHAPPAGHAPGPPGQLPGSCAAVPADGSVLDSDGQTCGHSLRSATWTFRAEEGSVCPSATVALSVAAAGASAPLANPSRDPTRWPWWQRTAASNATSESTAPRGALLARPAGPCVVVATAVRVVLAAVPASRSMKGVWQAAGQHAGSAGRIETVSGAGTWKLAALLSQRDSTGRSPPGLAAGPWSSCSPHKETVGRSAPFACSLAIGRLDVGPVWQKAASAAVSAALGRSKRVSMGLVAEGLAIPWPTLLYS